MKLILFKIDLYLYKKHSKKKSLLEVKLLEKTVLEALVLESLKIDDLLLSFLTIGCMSGLKLDLLGPEILGVKPNSHLSTFNYFVLFYHVSYVQISAYSFFLFFFIIQISFFLNDPFLTLFDQY